MHQWKNEQDSLVNKHRGQGMNFGSLEGGDNGEYNVVCLVEIFEIFVTWVIQQMQSMRACYLFPTRRATLKRDQKLLFNVTGKIYTFRTHRTYQRNLPQTKIS